MPQGRRSDPAISPPRAGAARAPAKKAPAAAAGARFQIGRFWLWYRADRDDWNICWLDGRITRRQATGIGGGTRDRPPEEAREALAEHHVDQKDLVAAFNAASPRQPAEALVHEVTELWLTRHVAHLDAPQRYIDSVAVLDRFYDHLEERRAMPEPFSVAAVGLPIVLDGAPVSISDAFIAWRKADGASAPTISRDLAALRSPINWALSENLITAAPRVKDVKGKKKKRELEWSPEQVAVILEAAWAAIERQHVHRFAMISLSTHGRTEAILELDEAEDQIRGGLIFFNAPDREQTRKRRSIVLICPTLAPWLEGVTGKVIRYRVPTSEKTRANGGPEYLERPTRDISNAFAGTILAAHEMRPDLGFARQAIDRETGQLAWLPPRRKLGETSPRPKMIALGSPNTLRHTIHTWHKRCGTPDAQIDAAAGHSEQGTGANYTHLRPEYLREFVANTELFWEAVGEFTDVHLRYQRDTNTASLAARRARR